MPQGHIWEHRFVLGDVHVLIAKIGPVNTKLPGDLGIEARSIEDYGGSDQGVAIKQGFIEPFVLWTDENRVSGEDRLPDFWSIDGIEQVAINGNASLEPWNGFWPRKERNVEGFVVLIVDFVLNRFFHQRGSRFAPRS